MTDLNCYGRSLGAHLHLNHAPALVSQTINKTPVAVTRCKLDTPVHGPTSPLPDEDAYMIVLQTGATSYRELWLDGKPTRTEPLNTGEVTLHDLRRRPSFKMYTPIDSVNFYIPRRSLDECTEEAEVRPINELRFTPGLGVNDRILAGLGLGLLPVFEAPEDVSQLFIDHYTRAIVAHVAHAFGGMQLGKAIWRRGLAPWQERRAKEFIDAHLDGDISVLQLATACRLSSSHFSRAFRQSTGMSPHQWLLRRRIEKAKALLRDPETSLASTAIAAGFANQSHFTRVFTRVVGFSPGRWRHANR